MPRTKISYRNVIFPVLLNFWPILLLVSQKALVPIGYFFVINGDNRFRIDVLLIIILSCIAGVVYFFQAPNEYATKHLIGFLAFLLSVPLLNYAKRIHGETLIRILSIFTIINSVFGILLYYYDIDLSNFRGLNRIVGSDELVHRVYFESTSLLAVYTTSFIKSRFLKIVSTFVVFFYALFVAKSIFVIALYLLNHVYGYVARASAIVKVSAIVFAMCAVLVIPAFIQVLRADIVLSLGVKLVQFETVMNSDINLIDGSGWGYVINDIANNDDQPYQIEMQLPMLGIQLGILYTFLIVLSFWILIRRTSENVKLGMFRFLIYLVIGFNNPWLFIPSWYLTSILMFRSLEVRR